VPDQGGTAVINGTNDGILYTPFLNFFGTETFTYTADDGNGGAAVGTVTVTVNPVNDFPVAVDDAYTIDEDTPGSVFTVLDNDTDVDNDPLTITALGPTDQGGVANINATNDAIIYTPALDYFGTETFTYTADDGNGGTDTGTVTITILPVDEPPVADDLNFMTTINTAIYPYLSGSDPDSDIFTFFLIPTSESTIITSAGGEATIISGDGNFNYQPPNGYIGVDTFTYVAWDGVFFSNPATVTVNVIGINVPPVAYDGLLNVVVNTSNSGTLAVTDANDPNGLGSYFFSIVANGSSGTAVIDDPATGAYTYTPNPGFIGTDTFTYMVNDGLADSNTATITVSVLDSPHSMVIKRISTTTSAEANSNSFYPALSADGRYIAFNSFASNLVPDATIPNGSGQIYVYDRMTDEIKLVSKLDPSDSNNNPGDNTSDYPSISSDGQYVAFSSFANNLVVGGTVNSHRDIFIRDMLNNQTEVISLSDSAEWGNNSSEYPVISTDGRYVAFESSATNLVADDTNNVFDIYVHDRLNNTTERVSISTSGEQGDRDSLKASISQNGRYVAFESTSTNLVSGSTGSQIFIRDRWNGTTQLASITDTGIPGNGTSHNPSISADGRYVVFESLSSNLIANDTNGQSDIFVYDRQTGLTDRVSISSGGFESNSDSFCYHQNSISADGQYVIFHSEATNLVVGDSNAVYDVFVHDRATGQTLMISASTLGAQGDQQSWWPSISADGQVKAFASEATNLIDNDTNNSWDVFIAHPFNN
jgi:hypothetical protein